MFKLNIESSNDIIDLHITFANGTAIKHEIREVKRGENFLNTDENFENDVDEIIKPPEIKIEKRQAKIADELQNLDI